MDASKLSLVARVHGVLERSRFLEKVFDLHAIVDHVNVRHVVGRHEAHCINDFEDFSSESNPWAARCTFSLGSIAPLWASAYFAAIARALARLSEGRPPWRSASISAAGS